jgi:hypothetical protein
MDGALALAATNLGSPAILSFALGLGAALLRSDLSVPEAAAKAISIYLLFSIGLKGGVAVAAHGVEGRLLLALLAGVVLSLGLPVLAFGLLTAMTRLTRLDRAAVAAHYGSISIVTFVAATSMLETRGIAAEGYMVAVAAAMEAPAIVTALWLAGRQRAEGGGGEPGLWREVLLNGSIVLLVGSFAIGAATGEAGLARVAPFVVDPFQGVLCLFLLDMGLVAGRGFRDRRGGVGAGAVAFGLVMPPLGAGLGLGAALLVGLSPGGAALLMTLAASASYIAVPAAMRVALPAADPAVSLTLSLGVTFPFNLVVGLPLYLWAALAVVGGGP